MKHVRLFRRLAELVVLLVVVLGSIAAVHDGDALVALSGGLFLGVLVTCHMVDLALWQRRRRERAKLRAEFEQAHRGGHRLQILE